MASFPGHAPGRRLVELAFLTRGHRRGRGQGHDGRDRPGRSMSWSEGQFEFRVGLLWPGPEVPAVVQRTSCSRRASSRSGSSWTWRRPERRRRPRRLCRRRRRARGAGRGGGPGAARLPERRRSRRRRGDRASRRRSAPRASSCRSPRSSSRSRAAARWASCCCVTRASSTPTARCSIASPGASRSSASSAPRWCGARTPRGRQELLREGGVPGARDGADRQASLRGPHPAHERGRDRSRVQGDEGVVAALMIPMTVLGSGHADPRVPHGRGRSPGCARPRRPGPPGGARLRKPGAAGPGARKARSE